MLLGTDPVRILRETEGGDGAPPPRREPSFWELLAEGTGGGAAARGFQQEKREAKKREEEELLANYQRSLVDGDPDTDPVDQPDYDPPRGLGSLGVGAPTTGSAGSSSAQGGDVEGDEDERSPFKTIDPRGRRGGGGRARGAPMVTADIKYRENVLPYAQKIQQNLNEAGEELRLQGAAQAVRGSELKAAYERQAKTLGDLATEYENARKEACLLYTSPSPRARTRSRMPSSA